MGTHDGIETRGRAWRASSGAVGAALLLLLALAAAPAAASALSRPGVQYWDEARARCRDCSHCNAPGHVVLRPCHVHQDTLCGHWRNLNIDWSWLRSRGRSRNLTLEATTAPAAASRRPHQREEAAGNPRRPHAHRKKLPWKEVAEDEPASGERSDLDATALKEANWHRFHKHHKHKSNSTSSGGPHKHHGKHHRGNHHHHHPHHSTTASPRHHHPHTFRPPESAAQLRAVDFAEAEASAASAPMVAAVEAAGMVGASGSAALQAFEARTLPPPEPFSSAEVLVWDWQVVVLTLAVVGCVLFFIAAAAYGIRQIRRDVRRTVDADSLTATLSLMVPEITNDLTEHCTLDGCNINQCLCMEQLLVRKQDEPSEGKGNVYIDRGSSKSHV